MLNEFDKTFSPLYRITIIFGLTIISHKTKRAVYSNRRYLYNVCVLLSYFILSFKCYHQLIHVDDTKVLIRTTDSLICTAYGIFTATTLLTPIFLKKEHLNLLNILNDVEVMFKNLNGNSSYTSVVKFMMIIAIVDGTISIMTTLCINAYLQSITAGRYFSCGILFYFPILLNGAFCFQVTSYIYLIKQRLQYMNREIRKMTENILDINDFKGGKKPMNTILVIGEFSALHACLTDSIQGINQTFGITILSLLLITFTQLVIGMYYLLFSEQKWNKALVGSMRATCFTMGTIILCHLCQKTSDEANETGILLYNIDTDDPDLNDEIDNFILQVESENTEFNAAGFFPINHKLIFMVLGTVATYIIILMQISGDNKEKT